MNELVSVVVAVRNVGETIDRQLGALAAQTYPGAWEVVVSDNGSTDDTRARVRAWSDRLPMPLRFADASDRQGSAHARNVGVQASTGGRVLMCDGDDVVSPLWVETLAAALCTADLATGSMEWRVLNPGLDPLWGSAAPADRPPHVPGGNLAFTRTTFDRIGGFDETLPRGQDLDFAWRAIAAGATFARVSDAVVHVQLRDTKRALVRQGFVDGFVGPLLYRRHRAIGVRRESRQEIVRSIRLLLRGAPSAVRGHPTHTWAYDAGQRAGRLVGSVRYRSLFL